MQSSVPFPASSNRPWCPQPRRPMEDRSHTAHACRCSRGASGSRYQPWQRQYWRQKTGREKTEDGIILKRYPYTLAGRRRLLFPTSFSAAAANSQGTRCQGEDRKKVWQTWELSSFLGFPLKFICSSTLLELTSLNHLLVLCTLPARARSICHLLPTYAPHALS